MAPDVLITITAVPQRVCAPLLERTEQPGAGLNIDSSCHWSTRLHVADCAPPLIATRPEDYYCVIVIALSG